MTVLTIAAREFKRYFSSPLAFAAAALIYLVLGGVFSLNLWFSLPQGLMAADGRMLLQPLVFILMFVAPSFTMRLLSEEQRSGTLELLLTAPVKEWELVIGKWLAAVGFTLVLLAGTWVFPIIINQISLPGIDQGALISAYVGLIALVSSLLALGLLASSFFSSPAAAYVTAVAMTLGLWILGGVRSGGARWLGYLGLANHYYDNLYQGILDLSDLTYFVSLTALGLFLTVQVVGSRRWR